MSEMSAPWWLAGSAIGGAIVLKVTEWFLQRKSSSAAENASAALINGLSTRITALEGKIGALETRVTEEVRLRLIAQEEQSRLQGRISVLVQVLHANGIEIPPEPPRPQHMAKFMLPDDGA